jgi:hypothetical protein
MPLHPDRDGQINATTLVFTYTFNAKIASRKKRWKTPGLFDITGGV